MPNFVTVKEWSELIGVKKNLCELWLDSYQVHVRSVKTGKRALRFVELGEIEALCAENKDAADGLLLIQLATNKNKRPRKEREKQEESEERVVDGVRVAKRRGK